MHVLDTKRSKSASQMSAKPKTRARISSCAKWTEDERMLLISLYPRFGTKWNLYQEYLKGRTESAIQTQWWWLKHRNVEPEPVVEEEPELELEPVVEEEPAEWIFMEYNF
jgi:hypothetical protein